MRLAAEEARREAAKPRPVRVDTDLVHRVTEKEYLAEQARLEAERDAPRRAAAKAFRERMAEGKRKKKERLAAGRGPDPRASSPAGAGSE